MPGIGPAAPPLPSPQVLEPPARLAGVQALWRLALLTDADQQPVSPASTAAAAAAADESDAEAALLTGGAAGGAGGAGAWVAAQAGLLLNALHLRLDPAGW